MRYCFGCEYAGPSSHPRQSLGTILPEHGRKISFPLWRDITRKAIYTPSQKTEKHVLRAEARERNMLWRLIKALVFLSVVGGIGLVIYAYVGPIFFPADFTAPSTEIIAPVPLDPK